MKTYQPKHKDILRKWHLVDAKGKILGRLATEIAKYLQGKHKVNYSAHMDMGDCVVVVNADKIELSGKKEDQKKYYRHSGYPGGFKEVDYKKMKEDHPERIIEMAVNGMLPKNRLHDPRMRRLKIFVGSDHPYGDKFKDKNLE
jgi:large subunit ribosomal protein L13